MASRISQLTALTGANTASGDLLPIVDVSDTTMAASGTDKKITLTELQAAPVSAGTANGVLYLNGSKVATSGSALVFDGANLGLGVTPSAWGNAKAIQIANSTYGASLWAQGGADEVLLGRNVYYTGVSYIYKASSYATQYAQLSNGQHAWYTAPSGTAGNAISFTQAMTLDASGNLLVGTTSSSSIAAGGVVLGNLNNVIGGAVSGGMLTMSGATTTSYVGLFSNPNGAVGSITIAGSTTAYNTSSDYRLKDNQVPLTNSGSFIDALKPKTWNWKADGTKGVGFIAHEVQEVSPTSVVGEKDAMRVEQYEISPAVPATYDEEGNELTPAVEAVMGEREVPAYQAMEYGSAEFIANIVAELQSLRKRVAVLEAAAGV